MNDIGPMLRQYELVERVRAYDPDVDEALLNRAYVFTVQKHGSQQVHVSLRAGTGDGPWWIAIQKGFGPLYLEQIGFGATMPGGVSTCRKPRSRNSPERRKTNSPGVKSRKRGVT